MKPFNTLVGIAALMNRNNIDTDQIIAKQFLKRVEKTGFGAHLFHDWRYNEDGTKNPEFELNNSKFDGSTILVAGDNFGCGSSREHAPWAIEDYGFRVIVSTSFADIFFSNCFKNGILPVVVTKEESDALMAEISGNEGVQFTANLEDQKLTTPGGITIDIKIDAARKNALIKGLDHISTSLAHIDKIEAFEKDQAGKLPWLWS